MYIQEVEIRLQIAVCDVSMGYNCTESGCVWRRGPSTVIVRTSVTPPHRSINVYSSFANAYLNMVTIPQTFMVGHLERRRKIDER